MTTTSDTAPEYPTLLSALAAFQADIPTIRKGNTARVDGQKGSYSYDYADLSDVTAEVLPRLASFGLVWVTRPDTADDGTINLHYSLSHVKSGEKIEGHVAVGRKGDRWQDVGASLTYARRYMLVSVTGIAPGGDDNDGQNATVGSERPAPPAKQYLPEGLYDLSSIDSVKAAEQMFYTARGNGHLGLIVVTPEGSEVPFIEWLRAQRDKYPAVSPEDEPKQEADDEEAAEREAIAWHEAELAAQEAQARQTKPARQKAMRDLAEAAGPTAREEAETAMREEGA